MKKIIRLIRNYLNPSLEVRESLFRFMLAFGFLASAFAFVETIFLNPQARTLIPLGLLFFILVLCIFLSTKRHHAELAATIIGIYMTLVLLPFIFFDNGGVEGGATIWFILGILYAFILFTGKKLIVFLCINIVADSVVYWVGYNYPQIVKSLDGRRMIFLDSLFSVIAVGLFCGAAMFFQILLFNKESNMVKEQKKELEEANRAQNVFFASMSHEIRTPINSILGLNEMVLRRSTNEEVLGYATNIQSSGRMLLKLVNDILDMSQLQQKRMELNLRDYKTEEMFRDIIDMLRIRMEEKHLNFQVDIDSNLPKRLYGDDKRIQQVIINLLTNAVKYTNEGSVLMHVSSVQENDGKVTLRIAIQDTGIGIRKEDMDKLYDVFKRVDMERNTKVEGSGLGLSITKQIVDLMDGEIKVDSIYTKGTTFTVDIKQNVVDAEPIGDVIFSTRKFLGANHAYEHSFEAPEAKILVVDDNKVNALVLAQLLSDTKVVVDIATSPSECLEKTKQRHYHVILMDNMMPGMSGAEVYKTIRKQENGLCQNTPVILLTATSVAEAQRIAEENGFDSFLEKPVQGEKLEEAILNLLPEVVVEYRRVKEAEEEVGAATPSLARQHKKKILITTDCISDLPEGYLEKYDIRVMYLYIQTPFGRFADTKEIDSDTYNHMMAGEGIEATAVSASVEEYEEFFASCLTEAEDVIHISMAANSGRTYGIAVQAAKGFDHVHVIDSRQISCGQGILVLTAGALLRKGLSCDEIIEVLERQKHRIHCAFLMPSSEDFARNGYLIPARARLLRILHVHPRVTVNNRSRIGVSGFFFGDLQEARRKFIRFELLLRYRIRPDIVMVTFVGLTYAEQEEVRESIARYFKFERVIFNKSSFSSSCNAGMKSIGIAYYRFAGDE